MCILKVAAATESLLNTDCEREVVTARLRSTRKSNIRATSNSTNVPILVRDACRERAFSPRSERKRFYTRCELTFARAESFASDANWRVVDAVVVFKSARRAVRAIIISAKERRLHHRTFLTSETKRGRVTRTSLNKTVDHVNVLIARVRFPAVFLSPVSSIFITLFPPHQVGNGIKIPRTYVPYEQTFFCIFRFFHVSFLFRELSLDDELFRDLFSQAYFS